MVIFVDTNVILDILQNDPAWANWSVDRLAEARMNGDAIINAIVVAELARDYPDVDRLRRAIAPLDLIVAAIDDAAALLAGHRFVMARRDRGDGPAKRPLPDFFIGAQAMTLGAAVLTRDASLYRRYFPELTLITPETHPHG